MKKSLLLLLLPLSFYGLCETELKGNPNELRTFLHPQDNIITITKSAEEIAFKDVAIVSLNVTTQQKKLSMSLQENTQLRSTISAFLVEQGIPLANIKNSKFSTSPDYGWFGDKPDSFKVSNTVTIRITDELGLQNIAKIVDKYEEVTLSNTQYEHSLKEEYLQKVQEKALNKVLAQKAFYGKKLDVKLQAISFREQGVYAQNDVEVIELRAMKSRSLMSKDDGGRSEPETPIKTTFEKLIYKATISVSFKVETID